MKKMYESPNADVITMNVSDIITLSKTAGHDSKDNWDYDDFGILG